MRENGAGSGRVLVVAAARVARALIVGQLAPHGFSLAEASTHEVALQLAGATPPDVVLLDAELPGKEPLALLDAFKQASALAHIPIVLISHRTDSEDVAAALERGAHDYLRKPVEPSELVARVMAAVRLKALQDRLRAINAELRHSAGTDALTGLANRRTAADHIDRLVSRARRHDLPFALVLVDVDELKSVNEREGHAVGDAALVEIGRRLGGVCRRGDLLARWGGDEMIVLTADGEDAQTLAERLRRAVADAPIEAAGRRLDLRVSAGWSAWRRGDEADGVLGRAELSLLSSRAGSA